MSDRENLGLSETASRVASTEATRPANALPLRPNPIECESLSSYGMRLAAANGLRNFCGAWEDYDIGAASLRPSENTLEMMVYLSGKPSEQILRLSPVWKERPGNFRPWDFRRRGAELMGQSLEADDFTRDRRVCPGCIAASPHEPLLWRVSALAGCLKHGTLFVSQCECGRKIDWAGYVDRCQFCSAELGSLSAEPMSSRDHDVTAYVEGRFHGTQNRVEGLDELTLGQALALLRWVGDIVDAGGDNYSQRAIYGSGFASLTGSREPLLARIRQVAGARHNLGLGPHATLVSAKVGPGRLQPALPDLVPEIAKPIAALVREAARS